MAGVPRGLLQKLLHQSDENDFTITCRTKAFKVEKAVVSAGSFFFRAVCNLSFRENNENRLHLPEEYEDVVASVLLFMYTGDYDDMQTPHFGTELPRAAGSSSTSSSNDSQISPSPNGLVAPLTLADGSTVKEGWTKCPWQNHALSEEHAVKRANSAQQQKMVKALEKNTKMYICADKLQINKLTEYAAEKFKKRLWAIADAKDTYPAVRLALENTRQEDTVLCNEALRYCIHHHQRIECFPTFLAYLQECEPTAWTIGVELQRKKDDQQSSLRGKLKVLEKEKLKAEIFKAQAEYELDSAVQLVNGTRFMLGVRCTNADMKLEIHTNELGTKQYQLTCKCCNKQQQGVYLTAANL